MKAFIFLLTLMNCKPKPYGCSSCGYSSGLYDDYDYLGGDYYGSSYNNYGYSNNYLYGRYGSMPRFSTYSEFDNYLESYYPERDYLYYNRYPAYLGYLDYYGSRLYKRSIPENSGNNIIDLSHVVEEPNNVDKEVINEPRESNKYFLSNGRYSFKYSPSTKPKRWIHPNLKIFDRLNKKTTKKQESISSSTAENNESSQTTLSSTNTSTEKKEVTTTVKSEETRNKREVETEEATPEKEEATSKKASEATSEKEEATSKKASEATSEKEEATSKKADEATSEKDEATSKKADELNVNKTEEVTVNNTKEATSDSVTPLVTDKSPVNTNSDLDPDLNTRCENIFIDVDELFISKLWNDVFAFNPFLESFWKFHSLNKREIVQGDISKDIKFEYRLGDIINKTILPAANKILTATETLFNNSKLPKIQLEVGSKTKFKRSTEMENFNEEVKAFVEKFINFFNDKVLPKLLKTLKEIDLIKIRRGLDLSEAPQEIKDVVLSKRSVSEKEYDPVSDILKWLKDNGCEEAEEKLKSRAGHEYTEDLTNFFISDEYKKARLARENDISNGNNEDLKIATMDNNLVEGSGDFNKENTFQRFNVYEGENTYPQRLSGEAITDFNRVDGQRSLAYEASQQVGSEMTKENTYSATQQALSYINIGAGCVIIVGGLFYIVNTIMGRRKVTN